MNKVETPRYAYAVVAGAAFLALVLFFLTLLKFEVRDSKPVLLASGISGILSVIFAYVWPGESWRWGVWASSGYWMFFGFVFISFILKGEFEAPPLVEAIVVIAFGCMGGILGRWFSNRVRENAAAR
jgi:hypothetical protein